MVRLAPSILSADFGRLLESVKLVEAAGVELLHIDVMDGRFVPNISFGPVVIKGIQGKTAVPFDIHLMIEDPDRYLEDFAALKPEYLTVHAEACVHLHRTIQRIRSLGVKPAVSLNPATPLCVLEEALPELDMVLLMSVNPGFGGQSFIEGSLDKIRRLRAMIDARSLTTEIQVDGGVTQKNARAVAEAGATILVAGSAVFGAPDVADAVSAFRAELQGL